jgi:hypothetical protein
VPEEDPDFPQELRGRLGVEEREDAKGRKEGEEKRSAGNENRESVEEREDDEPARELDGGPLDRLRREKAREKSGDLVGEVMKKSAGGEKRKTEGGEEKPRREVPEDRTDAIGPVELSMGKSEDFEHRP